MVKLRIGARSPLPSPGSQYGSLVCSEKSVNILMPGKIRPALIGNYQNSLLTVKQRSQFPNAEIPPTQKSLFSQFTKTIAIK